MEKEGGGRGMEKTRACTCTSVLAENALLFIRLDSCIYGGGGDGGEGEKKVGTRKKREKFSRGAFSTESCVPCTFIRTGMLTDAENVRVGNIYIHIYMYIIQDDIRT